MSIVPSMLPDFRVRQRDYLLEIARLLTQELDLEKLLARILRVSIEMLAGQAGIIALKLPDGWKVAAAHGIAPAFLSYLTPLLAEEKVRELDVIELNRMLKELTYTASMGLLNGTGLPLAAHGQVIGVIFIFRNYADVFTPNDRILLQSFADQAAIAVFNAQLYGQVSYEKKRLDALLDSAADGILILDSGMTIERCNSAFGKLYGAAPNDITGKPHVEIIRWKKTSHGKTLEESFNDGWPLSPNASLYVEGDLERPLPPALPVGVTYAPLLSDEGRLRNILISVRDITHFRTADELKSTFISIVSHELRTPVALIKGYASTLRRGDAQWDKRTINDSLAVIEEEADRLSKMIDDLLDASRMQAGGLSLNHADVVVPSLALRVSERFASQSPKHTIAADFPKNFPVILGDENRLEQVLSNLVSNALKYAPEGEIKISGAVLPEQVIVCVSDEGPGIDAKDLPHIFDRFYRSSGAVKGTKGAGLGLYLARAIVEAHGGRIWAESRGGSKSDSGARICFSLPR
ncbi:MAG: histidine kinase [Chloroflexi bacterium]|nr:PAS domain-containing protein [Chloroflexi bacterium CFX1]MCK6568330.1 ATP-binding protein [Anaerolineales bacterium]MCQ3951994.1 histidine kinase [Chloroflexota bacterium]MDL1919256.1 PAS domain-containing protein [Chloroflexi bacterium CFX5]NUQ60703.1 PAS domain-containing protein [Anaerolineales bacterium]